MKGKMQLLCAVMLLLVAGCDEPTAEEIKKAQELDIETIQGKVIALGIGEYKGDAAATANKSNATNKSSLPSKIYYWADIQYTEAKKVEKYRGLLPEVFESLSVGLVLPVTRVVSVSDLTRVQGRIVDMYRDPVQGIYMIMVINSLEHKIVTSRIGSTDTPTTRF